MIPPSPDAAVTLVLGGARSGKSGAAEALVEALPPPWHYLATAEALDAEMAERVARHRAARPPGWITHETPLDPVGALAALPPGEPALVDCLTLWLTNLMLAERDIAAETRRLAETLARPSRRLVLVANEVGLGIVPDNALARRFRDAAGRLNQTVAARADHVLFLVAGLPMRVK